ncbi:hypothetical protein [Paenibacillus tepidiphilus]|uniref:hypothetical protein n=1 Tax=Paenibacillus tepidiphilus TaxID=2608683 RepID=UPI001238C061|nr:hypothetical protein [Paenibacillus tepidiphilus]
MKETVLRALFMWLVVFILLQPMFSYIDYLLDLQVKANTSYITQKAATEGTVTSSMRTEVINNLSKLGIDPAKINITSSSATVQERKSRIDVYIKVPRINQFPFDFSSGSQPTYYYGHGSIMSEYLD